MIVFDDFFSTGESRMLLDGRSPGFVDWQGRKADSTGIGPVHLGWTVVDEGARHRLPDRELPIAE